VPATSKAPEQWSPADKLTAVIQSSELSGADLGAFCRERGLYPRQLARWRQAAEDANSPTAPSMADHKELQRRNQGQARARFIAQVSLYSQSLGVAIAQTTHSTDAGGETQALRQLLEAVELDAVLVQADALHANRPFSSTSPSGTPTS
jgi:transposase-like protein